MFGVTWAPDGEHLLAETGDPSAGLYIEGTYLIDVDGQAIRWYPSLALGVWIDNEHFILYSSSTTGVSADFTPDKAWLADTAGSDAQRVDMPVGTYSALENHHAAAAIDFVRGVRVGLVRQDFVVWSGGISSQPHDGYPSNWTLDGSKLAVIHKCTEMGCQGYLEVVSWPGLQTIFEPDPPEQLGDFAFDPTGQYVAYAHLDPSTDFGYVNRVVTLATGSYVDLRSIYGPGYYWANGYLNMDDGKSVHEFDTQGELVASTPAPGQIAESSADGSTVLFSNDEPATSLVVQRGDVLTPVELPTSDFYHPGWLSQDGSAIALASERSIFIRRL